jgi:enoyl-CoA hydratase
MAGEIVRYELDENVAVLNFDDGKANVIGLDSIAALHAGLDRAQQDGAGAILVHGRPGIFSAGFDMKLGAGDPAKMVELGRSGAEFGYRLFASRVPTVAAISGHAIAMGAILGCCFDLRIAADGDFKIGLNEAALGAPLPGWALVPVTSRVPPTHLVRAAALAEFFKPSEAVAAGFVDRVVAPDELFEEAFAAAAQLAKLDGRTHHAIKQSIRPEAIAAFRKAIDGFTGFGFEEAAGAAGSKSP